MLGFDPVEIAQATSTNDGGEFSVCAQAKINRLQTPAVETFSRSSGVFAKTSKAAGPAS
jgi:hypothetical protein